jgi:hypothetical protein
VGDGREGAHVLAWVVADGRRGGGQSRGRDERRRVGRLGKLQFLQWACCCVGASGGRRRAQAGTGEWVRGVCWCGMADGRALPWGSQSGWRNVPAYQVCAG